MKKSTKLQAKKQTGITFRKKDLAINSKLAYSLAVKDYANYINKTGKQDGIESVKGFLKSIEGNYKASSYNLKRQGLKEYLCEKYKNDTATLFAVQELFKSIKRTTVQKTILKDEYLTYDEVKMLSGKITPIMSAIFRALFFSGLRVSELCNIKLSDVKLNGKASLQIIGKGKREHKAYLPLNLYNDIRKLFKNENQVYLFETSKGKPYHRVFVSQELKRQCKKHGYDVNSHMLRHAKCMYLKNDRGLSADQIAKAVNHASVKTTLEFYFHGTPSSADQGIESDGF